MRRVLVALIAMVLAGCAGPRARNDAPARKSDSEKYFLIHYQTSARNSGPKVVAANGSSISGQPFDRDDCADKILQYIKMKYNGPGYYAKNGIFRSYQSKDDEVLYRYVCLPESAVERVAKENKWWSSIDPFAIKEISNTIELAKADFYTVLPLDDKNIARAETERLNKITVFDPSFSCENLGALTEHEQIVCKSVMLSERDKKIAELYKKAVEKHGDEARKSQREWLKKARTAKWQELHTLYYKRIGELSDMISDCKGVGLLFKNIMANQTDGDVARLAACVMDDVAAADETKQSQIESGLWLGYLYFDRDEPDTAKKYIARAIEIAKTDCGDGHPNNFCYGFGVPDKIESKSDLYDLFGLLANCISYEMIEYDQGFIGGMSPRFGSSRDAGLAFICDYDSHSKYKWLSVENITKLENYKKAAKVFDPEFDERQGTMWIAVRRGGSISKIDLVMFPDKIKRFKADSFAGFEKEMNKYPDMKKAYSDAVKTTKDYYMKTLRVPKDRADELAAYAVRLMILWDIDSR